MGKINGSKPQNTATVASVMYLIIAHVQKTIAMFGSMISYSCWNIVPHPGVSSNSLVIHRRIIMIKIIPTQYSLHLNMMNEHTYV